MSLNADDITNIERGIDAAVNAIIGMVQQSIVSIARQEGVQAVGPLTGFVQAINENREALNNKCLLDAIAAHPDTATAEVQPTEGNPS